METTTKEVVRVLSDGNRLVVVIENPDAELVQKVKDIFGVTIEKITGLSKPPAPKETTQDHLYRFPSSSKKYSGKTVVDVFSNGDVKYMHYILCKTQYKRKIEIWRDINKFHVEIAKALEEQYKDNFTGVLSDLCELLDSEPGKEPVLPPILENIGAESVENALKDPNDASYVFETLIDYLRTKGETNG